MNLTNRKSGIFLLTVMFTVSMALMAAGCKSKTNAEDTGLKTAETSVSQQQTPSGTEAEDGTTVLGEGKTKINFVVTDKDGKETCFEIHTDKDTVGDALLEHNLIAGDMGDYGLYVKQVNGITADYDVDQTYWAFYINGEYATSGVDSTSVKEGDTYALKIEK